MNLPEECPRCRAPANDLLLSGTTEPRFARRLQRTAPVVALLTLAGLLVWFFVFGNDWLNGGGHGLGFGFGWGFIALLFAPSLAVYWVSMLFPHVRQVSCTRCGWSEEIRVPR